MSVTKEIQKRCPIQPGMLIKANVGQDERQSMVTALVYRLSPMCKFDEDYPGAEEHIFYMCQPLNNNIPEFAEYVTNMEKVS